MIRFSQLSDFLVHKWPSTFWSVLEILYVKIIEYGIAHFKNTKKYKKGIVHYINTASYIVLNQDTAYIPQLESCPTDSLPNNLPDCGDDYLLEDALGKYFLDISIIDWDVDEAPIQDQLDIPNLGVVNLVTTVSTPVKLSSDDEFDKVMERSLLGSDTKELKADAADIAESLQSIAESSNIKEVVTTQQFDISSESVASNNVNNTTAELLHPTPDVLETEVVDKSIGLDTDSNSTSDLLGVPLKSKPEDLSLFGPQIPLLDTSKVWKSGTIFGKCYCIYHSLPAIPTKQSEISVTTDLNTLTDSELLALYPDSVFYTRYDGMYTQLDEFDYDELLGVIFPIADFSRNQIIDNIIKYPHLEQIYREGVKDGQRHLVEFWKRIEIDGQLYKTLDIWNDLPDVKYYPKYAGLVQEYVIRRYLLERDILHIEHRYKPFGALDPFLTLFMPADEYHRYGYHDTISIAKQCVASRVAYKRTRNPVLRRLEESDG